jgi:hypothetical protein
LLIITARFALLNKADFRTRMIVAGRVHHAASIGENMTRIATQIQGHDGEYDITGTTHRFFHKSSLGLDLNT